MIDLNSTQADQVVRALFLSGFFALISGRTITMAIMKATRDTNWVNPDRVTRFIGRDSVIFTLTLMVSIFAFAVVLAVASPSYVYDVLVVLRNDSGSFGWTINVLMLTHLVAPFLVAGLLLIGRRRRIRRFGPLDTLGYGLM